MVPRADFISIELSRWRAAAIAWNANQKKPNRCGTDYFCNAQHLSVEKTAHMGRAALRGSARLTSAATQEHDLGGTRLAKDAAGPASMYPRGREK
jgi:hypothetical protein